MGTTDVKAGSTFDATACSVGNLGDTPFNGKLYIALVTHEGNIREILGSTDVSLRAQSINMFSDVFRCISSVDAADDDVVVLLSKAQDSTNYQLVYSEDTNVMVTIPATGYTPRTVDISFDLGEGITSSDPSMIYFARKLASYNGKPLYGSTYSVCIKVPEDSELSIVRLNGKRQSRQYVDSTLFAIYACAEDAYIFKARSYTADELIDHVDVAVSKPGSLESQMAEYNPDVVRSITVTGEVDQRDFVYLNKSEISDIDMMDTKIVYHSDNEIDYNADWIPHYAFENNLCLKRFVMPWSIVGIGYDAFSLTGLKEITIPVWVENYGLNVFANCQSLVDVTVLNPEPAFINWCVLIGTLRESEKGTLHVPAGSAAAYRAASEWGDFTYIVEDAEDIYAKYSDIYTSIDAVETSAAEAGVTVNGRTISVADAERIAVYNAEGKCVSRSAKTTVAPGFYIILVDGKSVKVAVN